MRQVLVGALAAAGLLMAAPAGAEPSAETAAKFDTFSIAAQSQAGTGHFYASTEEENHIGGAQALVDKPEHVVTLAAFLQRGTVAGYTYGATVGGGENAGAGGAGIAPEPPPGEANGQYPSTPAESTYEGPVTAGAGQVVDVRSHAKATATPSGEADFAFQNIDVPDVLRIGRGVSRSRGEPTALGLEAEARSVLESITIGGALTIDSMVSHAYALFPAEPGDVQTTALTVLEGASVNGTPVEITNGGIRVADQAAQGAEQKAELDQQVAEALGQANISDIRLAEASTKVDEDGLVEIKAGMLVVEYRNNEFGGSNPHGFSGGGFGVGGAELSIEAVRATADATAFAARPGAPSDRFVAGATPGRKDPEQVGWVL